MKIRGPLTILAFAAAVSAHAQMPTVILSNIAGSPSNDVPTQTGRVFNPGGSSAAFDRPMASANFGRWILSANMDDPTDDKDIIITGEGLDSSTFRTILVEDEPTFFDSLRTYESFDAQYGINNDGTVAFGGNASGSINDDEYIARFSAASGQEVMVREAQPVPFLSGPTYGATMDSSIVLGDGKVIFKSVMVGPAENIFAVTGTPGQATGLVETNVTVPTGQFFAPDQVVGTISAGRIASSEDGSVVLWFADLDGPTATDTAMVVNNSVVAQEGAVLPGSSFAEVVSSFTSGAERVSPNGSYTMFQGANLTTSQDWMVLNGRVIAAVDQPITPGNSELFDDAPFSTCFFGNAVNNYGDYIVAGVTNSADVLNNAVWVLNGCKVVLRENMEVDVTGDGVGDGWYLKTFNNYDHFLTDTNMLYFTADISQDPLLATSTAQAFMSIQLPLTGDIDGDGEVGPGDFAALAAAFLSAPGDPNWNEAADLDCDGEVGPGDFDILSRNFLRSI